MTQQKSTQIQNLEAQPPVGIPTTDWKGSLRFARFSFEQVDEAGAAGSLAELVRLPAGNIRVILGLSYVAFSAMGASRTMDLGWLAYETPEGVAMVADPNGLDDGVPVSGAGSVTPDGTVQGDETFLFQSKAGVTLTAQINGGQLGIGETLNGYFAYVQD